MKRKSKRLLQELMKYIKGDVLCKMKNGCFATSLLSVVVMIPNSSFSLAVFSSRGLDTINSCGLTTFCVKIPVIIACAMFPHPINPSFIPFFLL